MSHPTANNTRTDNPYPINTTQGVNWEKQRQRIIAEETAKNDAAFYKQLSQPAQSSNSFYPVSPPDSYPSKKSSGCAIAAFVCLTITCVIGYVGDKVRSPNRANPSDYSRIDPPSHPDPSSDSGKSSQPKESYTSPCSAGVVPVNMLYLTTSSANSYIVEGDGEIDSDDWTSIGVSYQVNQVHTNEVQLTLTWYAQELNKDQSRAGTRIASSKTFRLFSTDSSCPGSTIKGINGLQFFANREARFYGKIHGFVSFPDVGSLRNIRVRFDGQGGHDKQWQSLKADLSGFSVSLSPSN